MKNKNILLIIIAIIVVGFIWYAFGKGASKTMSPDQGKTGKLNVVATFYPMYFFATQIGGEHASVKNITPADAEPHDYEATTKDIADVMSSDLFVVNGGGANAPDTWANKLFEQLKNTKTAVVVAGEGLANGNVVEDGKKIQDPHVWQDPNLAKLEVSAIEKGYEKADPQNKAYYQKRAKDLSDKLDALDTDFKQGLVSCRLKDFVTSHAAFGYLAARYGINQVAISGVSPEEEPTPQKLVEIADLVKKENIKVIFFESLVSPKLSDTIANETGAKAMVLDPIEGISDDNVKAGHTYLTVMNDNMHALQTALECGK